MSDPGLYGKAVFRNYVEDGPAKAGLERITHAHKIPQVQSQDFKLQLLTIPGLGVEALYLTSTVDAIALVMPISSFAPEFPVDMVMDAPAFLSIARKIARSRLAVRTKSVLSS
jgi:hypothetical protein